MSRKLLWKFLLVIATGTVALFYLINYFTSQTEADMSLLTQTHQNELAAMGRHAETLYYSGNKKALSQWITELELQENTKISIVEYDYHHIGGNILDESYYIEYQFGRNIAWPVHLHFEHLPLMEIPFQKGQISFLILLPERMKPGGFLPTVRLVLQVFLPLTLLTLLAFYLYRHITQPLAKLQAATGQFSKGDYSVRVREQMGNRNDELTELATTFDNMAARIGHQIVSQRHLISDLSHELRTPLTRLDIAIQSLKEEGRVSTHLDRIDHESHNICQLVNDSLTLAWLENEQPSLQNEMIDLTDLLDVIMSDAQFEFPDKHLELYTALDQITLSNSNHQSLGQALENILRNALRYTPPDKTVSIVLTEQDDDYHIAIHDQGPGVPDEYLAAIFKPFFRLDSSTLTTTHSCGLGLALARRQLAAIGGSVFAINHPAGGLQMNIQLPKA